MIMADVWKILFLILGTQAVMVSYWLLAAALFPMRSGAHEPPMTSAVGG